MLIESPRHISADLRHWRSLQAADERWSRLPLHARRVERAKTEILAFVAEHPDAYLGVSWGKDSVCMASLVSDVAPQIRVAWFHAGVIENPDNATVRDAFLATHPYLNYHEIDASELRWIGDRHDGGQACFERESKRFGGAYLSGVRAAESSSRARRFAMWGHSSPNTCAPLSLWSGEDVFAFLHARNLPVHPAYACTFGGLLDRARIRVSTIGGTVGTGTGRAEWERAYYGLR
jgi:phosphoadenosine phosphosulfate reductase